MGKFTIIASLIVAYVAIDAILLGAFNKKLPLSVISLIKGNNNNKNGTPTSFKDSPQNALEKEVTNTKPSYKRDNPFLEDFSISKTLGKILPL